MIRNVGRLQPSFSQPQMLEKKKRSLSNTIQISFHCHYSLLIQYRQGMHEDKGGTDEQLRFILTVSKTIMQGKMIMNYDKGTGQGTAI